MFEHIRLEGDFTLSSGKKSPYFYDFDLLTPNETLDACEKLIELIDQSLVKFDFVVAPALGGIIPGFMVSGSFKKPLVTVDKEGKVRGPKVNGNFIIIDDTVSTYQTVERIKKIFEDCKCVAAASYIFRGKEYDKSLNTISLFKAEEEV